MRLSGLLRDALIGLLVLIAALVSGYVARRALMRPPVASAPCGWCLDYCDSSRANGYEYHDGEVLCRCDCGET